MPTILEHLERAGGATATLTLANATLAAFAHVAADKDRAEVAKLVGGKRNAVFPSGAPDAKVFAGLSTEQKLLMRSYLHVYATGRQVQDAWDRLSTVDAAMGLSDGLGVYLKRAVSPASAKDLLEGSDALAAVMAPSAELQGWMEEVATQARRAGPFAKKHALLKLEKSAYEHSYDRAAFAALEATPGLSLLVRKLNELGLDRWLRVRTTGSNVRVTERCMADLYATFLHACDVLDVKPVPKLYVENGPLNAWTAGVEDPIVVLSSAIVDSFTEDELLFVIGHELGHIKSKHVLYRQIALVFPTLAKILGAATMGIGGLVLKGVEFALLDWFRKSELTCDRAGLLACQDVDAATTAMMKLGGLPARYYAHADPAHFMEQAEEFERLDGSALNRAAKFLSTLGTTHPWTVQRAAELTQWISAGEYERILTAHGVPAEVANRPSRVRAASDAPSREDRHCAACNEPLRPGAKFCMRCGAQLSAEVTQSAAPKKRRAVKKTAGARRDATT